MSMLSFTPVYLGTWVLPILVTLRTLLLLGDSIAGRTTQSITSVPGWPSTTVGRQIPTYVRSIQVLKQPRSKCRSPRYKVLPTLIGLATRYRLC
ncbi:hypothetical protein F4861DRAFT_491855 [Xylaria intraflava]|nr:hypothetical protein F4861DRAFT_491855 [Xylaria intraflava]